MKRLVAVLSALLLSASLTSSGFAQVGGETPQSYARGEYPGTNTNDNAVAGNIGEVITASVVQGSAVSLTSNTPANITSITLTPGDWDITAYAGFVGSATTTVTYLLSTISTTTGAINETIGQEGAHVYSGFAAFANLNHVAWAAGRLRVSIAATTTYFLVSQAQFGASTLTGFGMLRARRMR